MATSTMPSAWASEELETIATVRDILNRQAEQARAASNEGG